MRFDVLTIHPDLVRGALSGSMVGRALSAGVIELGAYDLRQHGLGRHRSVDDAPYGGGPGMVLRVDVVAAGIDAVRRADSHVVLLSASGRRFDHARAAAYALRPHLVLVCGHYEGVDARVEALVDEELSIGDFVLTGGEIAAAAVVDAVARLIPGVLGNAGSPVDESFAAGRLEYPHFTRPRSFRGMAVPEVLLSGDHERIAAWRQEQALDRTRARRPDLLASVPATSPPVDGDGDLD